MPSTIPLPIRDRLAGGLVGLLVGDALGVPYEFHPPQALPPLGEIEYQPPPGFRRSHVGVPPGTWSDDGAHALVLLDSLLERDGLDLDHLASGLRRWLMEGRYAVNRSVFDIGSQTSTALNRLASGIPPDRSGPDGERNNGNGSLMRVLPLVLWHIGPDAELVRLADRQSLPTHGHARSRIACAFYCLWARTVLAGGNSPWLAAENSLRAIAPSMDWPEDEIERVLDPGNAGRVGGSGHVIDTLWSARQAVEATHGYEACVRHAIGLGHDTDTTAAVAGGIAGLIHGLDGIPARWRDGLRGATLYQPLLGRLLRRRCPEPSE
jgi:ADP-ribosylglycohydrolase